MALPVYTITCTEKQKIARDVYVLRFTKPEGFVFKPGQFILFDIPLIDKLDDIQTRAFSLASTGTESELLIVVRMTPGGRASRWFEEKTDVGTQFSIKGPFGNFLLDTRTEKEYLFIATSTGVGPFRSQIMDALARGDGRKMDLVFGVRSEEDLFWKEEFEKLTQQYENFYFHLALSNPSGDFVGHKGRVQTLVPLIIHDFFRKNVYICGSPDMTKELKQLSLEQWGIEKSDLHVEGYI